MKLRRLPLWMGRMKYRPVVIALASLALVALVGIGYGVWSIQTWKDYPSASIEWQKDIKKDIDIVTNLPFDTAEQRRTLMTRLLTTTQHNTQRQKETCDVSVFIKWQLMFDSLSQAEARCQKVTAKLVRFSTELRSAVSYLQDDMKLAAIVSDIPQPEAVSEAEWGAQPQYWATVVGAIGKLSIGEDFKAAQQTASTQAVAVQKAWQSVVAAHEKKDKTAYLAAQAELTEAYEGLSAVSDTSRKALVNLSAKAQVSYQQATGSDA